MSGFVHEALLYAGEDEFVDACASFVRSGVEAGEPTFIVVAAGKIELLREALGGDADGAYFADIARVGRNPARIIPAWQQFVARHAGPGVRLRGIGEAIGPDRVGAELLECQRHDALLNVAFSGAGDFRLLCPYDLEALPSEVIEEARRTHPAVSRGPGLVPEPNADYCGAERLASAFAAPLSEPPNGAAELHMPTSALTLVRRFVAEQAESAGLSREQAVDLTAAANEIAGNSLEHGGGPARVRTWREDGRFVCELAGPGEIRDPLVDRRTPRDGDVRGRGFWIANQICDLVELRSSPAGTVARLHVRLS